ncbi:hypothetical protein QPK87_28610 [Kamptonema cortianum]|nr:hypothetical protein [Kamptonema cortianum]
MKPAADGEDGLKHNRLCVRNVGVRQHAHALASGARRLSAAERRRAPPSPPAYEGRAFSPLLRRHRQLRQRRRLLDHTSG